MYSLPYTKPLSADKGAFKTMFFLGALTLTILCIHATADTLSPSVYASPFVTPLTVDLLDSNAFAAWVDGAEQQIQVKRGPRDVIWTQTTTSEWPGATFGESKSSGVRHMRIGWKSPLTVGTVLVRAGGSLSVLKADVVYPGRLHDDADWIPAQRIKDGRLSGDAVEAEEYAVWVLPPKIRTRALRFTYVSEPTDKNYRGWLGGVFILRERFANMAPQAVVSASSANDKAMKLNNASNDYLWETWDNAPDANAPTVSSDHPAWIMFTWPQPIKLQGMNALWAGFREATVQAYIGPSDRHPREARESDWVTVRSFNDIESQYPRPLGVNWLDFNHEVTTRAVRFKITQSLNETGASEHLKGKTRDGRRVWLGELLALKPLGDANLASAAITKPAMEQIHPPIPIRFKLPEAGFVTLVIEGADGRRVRNLIAETQFPAGESTVWWDGTDDLLRDPEAARHGVYHIPAQFVQPGNYRIRGLWRKQIDLRYEFSIYNAGRPAWGTEDTTGAWLANHTPPSGALFVPADRAPGGKPLIYLGSFVTEGGHGLAWVDLNGRKQGGVGWVGDIWTGAPFLARDDGPARDTNVIAYVAAPWSPEANLGRLKEQRGEIRLTAITSQGMKPIFKHFFTPSFATNRARAGNNEWYGEIGALAARNGVLVFSLPKLNQLVFVNSRNTNIIAQTGVSNPRGLAFDQKGFLYVLSGATLLRYDFRGMKLDSGTHHILLPQAERFGVPPSGGSPVKTSQAGTPNLEDPRQLAFDTHGNLYITDQGASHQVKVFSPTGQFLRAIGKPGAPKAGAYDPLHMNNPDGLTVDSLNRLWVAENDFQPKRVSVWTLDGKLVHAFYGPGEYGGGGKLDPDDKTRFYYHGMEFRLDWAKGTDRLIRVFSRPGPGDLAPPDGHGSTGVPEQPHYVQGRRYWSNDHNSNPTGGPGVAMLWIDIEGIARPVAALGRANDWSVLKSDVFKSRWPFNINFKEDDGKNSTLFAWSDINGDGHVQPDEVMMQKAVVGSVTVSPDMAFIVSRVGTNAKRYAPLSFTQQGVPVYDLAKSDVLAIGSQAPVSSGGDQGLWHKSGWTILTTPPKPFSPYSIGAVFRGEPSWSYPNAWPGLHASHESPPPSFPGMVIGTTRLLGDFITPHGSDAGPLWSINGNQGNVYLFTIDGLFVAELFKDVRRGSTWSMPAAQRDTRLNSLTLHDENFWPSLTQTKDGKVYMVDGTRMSLVRVDGLETIRRIPESTLTITANDLAQARAHFLEAEAARQKDQGKGTIHVPIQERPPKVDGLLDDWANAGWVDIDKSGVAAYFDSKNKPNDVRGALAVSGSKLYAAFRTGDKSLLGNSGELPNALFKTGGALDLMLGTNAIADSQRSAPVAGDVRLLVTQVKGRTVAMLYRAVVPGTKEPVPFSSPSRTITLDRVENVSAQVQLAGTDGNFEVSIPLTALGLKPVAGQRIRGDIGILRGNGFQTVQRVYWSNKAGGITADVPSEAELTPWLWGMIEFVPDR